MTDDIIERGAQALLTADCMASARPSRALIAGHGDNYYRRQFRAALDFMRSEMNLAPPASEPPSLPVAPGEPTCGMCLVDAEDGPSGATCGKPAVGTHEKTVRVCRACATDLEGEGFVVAYDTPSDPAVEPPMWPAVCAKCATDAETQAGNFVLMSERHPCKRCRVETCWARNPASETTPAPAEPLQKGQQSGARIPPGAGDVWRTRGGVEVTFTGELHRSGAFYDWFDQYTPIGTAQSGWSLERFTDGTLTFVRRAEAQQAREGCSLKAGSGPCPAGVCGLCDDQRRKHEAQQGEERKP
jgi:hypothetical protein